MHIGVQFWRSIYVDVRHGGLKTSVRRSTLIASLFTSITCYPKVGHALVVNKLQGVASFLQLRECRLSTVATH